MAVNSPARKVQLTRLTATWPPKRMLRSRVSRLDVIRASSEGLSVVDRQRCRILRASWADLIRASIRFQIDFIRKPDGLPGQAGNDGSKPGGAGRIQGT